MRRVGGHSKAWHAGRVDKADVRRSKHLALMPRHRPGSVGLSLDDAGWVNLDPLLEALRQHGTAMTRDDLDRVVRTNDKQRFEWDRELGGGPHPSGSRPTESGSPIRCRRGSSSTAGTERRPSTTYAKGRTLFLRQLFLRACFLASVSSSRRSASLRASAADCLLSRASSSSFFALR